MSDKHILRMVTAMTAAFLALWIFPALLIAQGQPEVKFAPVAKGFVLADVDTSEFHSKFTGHDYKVYVSLPASYSKGDQRYPTLYVPDFDEAFLSLRGANRIMGLPKLSGGDEILDEFILVGVPLKWEGVPEWLRQRTFDLTPTENDAFTAPLSKQIGGEVHSGGAALFLRTLKEELIPFIESKYRVNSDRGLCGFSFGGLFATYVLLNDRSTFSRYLIGSPSLRWDKGTMLKAEASVAESGKPLRGRVFLSVGGEEDAEGMIAPFKTLTTALKGRAYPDLQLESYIFEGENHFTAVQPTLSRGLRFLYAHSKAK
jgi:hypothetical protein